MIARSALIDQTGAAAVEMVLLVPLLLVLLFGGLEAGHFIWTEHKLIEGVREMYGAPVTVTDLRAGAALIVAGLMAKGLTEIYETGYIDRGYERIEEKLRSLGADIRREKL